MSAKYKMYHFIFKQDGKTKHLFKQYKAKTEEELLKQFHNDISNANDVKYELSSIADLENFLAEQVRKEKEYLESHPEIAEEKRERARRSKLRLQGTLAQLAGICAAYGGPYDYGDYMPSVGSSGEKEMPLPRTVVGENMGRILTEFKEED